MRVVVDPLNQYEAYRKMKNVHQQTARQLQQKTKRLIARLLKGKEPDFLRQHARLLDDYFQQAFGASMVGSPYG